MVPGILCQTQIEALSMKHVKPSSEKALLTLKVITTKNINFLTSFVAHRGGSRHEFRIHDMSKNFYDCVEAVVGKPEAS